MGRSDRHGASEYLVSRAEGAPPTDTPSELMAGSMFFQMWKARQDPYQVLADGDTLWWVDQRSREVRWELRVANLRRSQYRSITQAMDWLRRWYGVLPSDLTEYQNHQSNEGWLIAWEHEIVGPVGVPLPEGEKLGRNGFRRVSTADARRFGLPSPGRAAVFQPEPIPAEPAILAPPRDRTIPQATKSAVWQRDGANCGICRTTQGPWHIDHIFPFSKGGSNTVENLRILCAACNLRKGSAVEGSDPVVPATPELVDAARTLGATVPSDVHELGDILGRLVEDGLHNQALGVAWALDAHPDTSGELIDAIVEALRPVDSDEARLFELLQSDNPGPDRLLEFARSDDPEVAGRAAAEASRVLDGTAARLEWARRGQEQTSDPRVKALAAVTIGELTENDDEWLNQLLFAYEHAAPLTAAEAALRLGAEIDDDQLSYVFLEEATRSSSIELASLAARCLAERFAEDPEIAERYKAMHDTLEAQVRAPLEEGRRSETTDDDGYADMVRTLGDAGLPAPPVPDSLRPAIRRLGDWLWGTSAVSPMQLYMRDVPDGSDDGFVFGHVGYGFNSYFLVYTWWSPTHVVAERLLWGGAYSGSETYPVVDFFDRLRESLASPSPRLPRRTEVAPSPSRATRDQAERRNRARRGLPSD